MTSTDTFPLEVTDVILDVRLDGTRHKVSFEAARKRLGALASRRAHRATGAIVATFLLYAIPHVEARALVSVAVFGPFTLLHPWVCVAGTALSIAASDRLDVQLLILVAGIAMVSLEPALGRAGFGRPKPLNS